MKKISVRLCASEIFFIFVFNTVKTHPYYVWL